MNVKKKAHRFDSKNILALAFILFIFYVGTATVPVVWTEFNRFMKPDGYNFTEFKDVVNSSYKDMLTTQQNQPQLKNKGTYINLNGLMARIMGQRSMNERVKLDNGHLIFTIGLTKIDSTQIVDLYSHQLAKGKDFLFVMTPNQISKYEASLPIGHQDFSNYNADLLIDELRKQQIPFLDLRETMQEQGMEYSDAFYVTDHHWKVETGVWAYMEIVRYLMEMGAAPSDAMDNACLNMDNYEFRMYKECFLGSAGKRTGQYYAGVDDFAFVIPKFETHMSLEIPTLKLKKSGNFEDVAFNMGTLSQNDYFNSNPYGGYGYGDRDYAIWRNKTAPIDKKILMFGDSFGNVPFSFLPLAFTTCDEMDMRHYKGNFQNYYNDFEPDIVICLTNPGSINQPNVTYDFFQDK